MKNPCTKPCREFAVENGLCHCYESGVEREMAPMPEPEHNLTLAEKMLLPIAVIFCGLFFIAVYIWSTRVAV